MEDKGKCDSDKYDSDTSELDKFEWEPYVPKMSDIYYHPFDFIWVEDLNRTFKAVHEHDAPKLRSLIKEGYKVYSRDYTNCTLLHHAMLKNNLQILNILLAETKIDVDTKNALGETPLLYCLGTATHEMIYRLLDAGCSIHETDIMNNTALHLAIFNDVPLMAHEFIKRGANINAEDFVDGTPLHAAVIQNMFDCVLMLLYYNADPTIVDNEQSPPLLLSINNSVDLKIAHELVKYCPDLTVTNSLNYNCLLLALKEKHSILNEIIDVIGDGINAISCYGETALHFTLDYSTNYEFKLIWQKIDKTVLLRCGCDFLRSFLLCRLPTKDWLECFYMILECELIAELLGNSTWISSRVSTSFTTISDVLLMAFKRRNIQPSHRIKILSVLLSYGTYFEVDDLNLFYQAYGLGEELYTFTLVDWSIDHGDYFKLVAYLMGKEQYFNSPTKEFADFFVKYSELEWWNLRILCRYFALHHLLWRIKPQQSLPYRNVANEFCDCKEYVNNFVPSLIELSRSMSRYYVSQHFDVSKTYMLHHAVKTLTLSERIKDIILFKVPIYNETQSSQSYEICRRKMHCQLRYNRE